MHAEKSEQRSRMNPERLIKAAPCSQMSDCNPRILGVPDDWWQCANYKHREERIKTHSFEFAAQPWGEGEHQYDGEKLESVRVFGEETEPDKQTSQRPKQIKIWTALDREPECEHRRR